MPAMALGFYHEDRNGLNIIGHGGDTDLFHSDLHLFLDKSVGLYMSMNSAGKDGAAHALRERIASSSSPTAISRRRRKTCRRSTPPRRMAQAMAGHYVSSRAGGFNFLRLAALLGETTVGVERTAS